MPKSFTEASKVIELNSSSVRSLGEQIYCAVKDTTASFLLELYLFWPVVIVARNEFASLWLQLLLVNLIPDWKGFFYETGVVIEED